MAGVLGSVNHYGPLVGQKRLVLLLFNLDGSQLYGINVCKVKEELWCPKLSEIPKPNTGVRGL